MMRRKQPCENVERREFQTKGPAKPLKQINLECSRNRVETGMAGSQRVVEKVEGHEVRERQGPNHAGPDSWEVVVVRVGRS